MPDYRILAAGGTSVTGTDGIVFIALLVVFIGLSTYLTFARTRDQGRLTVRRLAEDVDRGLDYLDLRIRSTATALQAPVTSVAADVERSLDDARGRLTAARELREQSPRAAVLRAVRHTVLEGLAAVREARSGAGLDPGPLPPPPSAAPLTPEPVDVTVAGVTHRALPGYAPGSPHHFAGGELAGIEVPGGWYAEPFWEPLLLAAGAGEDGRGGSTGSITPSRSHRGTRGTAGAAAGSRRSRPRE